MKKLIIAASIVTTSIALVFGYRVYSEANFIATTEREPFTSMDLDKAKLRKAYNQIFREVLSGDLNIDDKTEADMDELLLQRYSILTSE